MATIETLHKTIIIDIYIAIYITRTREFERSTTLQEVAIALIDGHIQTILPEIKAVLGRIRQAVHIGIKDKLDRCAIGEVEHRLLLIPVAIPFVITAVCHGLQHTQLSKVKTEAQIAWESKLFRRIIQVSRFQTHWLHLYPAAYGHAILSGKLYLLGSMRSKHKALSSVLVSHQTAVGQTFHLTLHATQFVHKDGIARAGIVGAAQSHRRYCEDTILPGHIAPLAFHATAINGTHTSLHAARTPTACRSQCEEALGEGAEQIFAAGRSDFELIAEVARRVLGISSVLPLSTQHTRGFVQQKLGSLHPGRRSIGFLHLAVEYAELSRFPFAWHIYLAVTVHIHEKELVETSHPGSQWHLSHIERRIPVPAHEIFTGM